MGFSKFSPLLPLFPCCVDAEGFPELDIFSDSPEEDSEDWLIMYGLWKECEGVSPCEKDGTWSINGPFWPALDCALWPLDLNPVGALTLLLVSRQLSAGSGEGLDGSGGGDRTC